MTIKRRVTFNEDIMIHYYDTESTRTSTSIPEALDSKSTLPKCSSVRQSIKSKLLSCWFFIKKFFNL